MVSFSSFNTMAQISYKTTNFTHDLAQVKVSISVLNIESFLTPITAGVLVEGQLIDKLFYNVQFRQGYLRNFMIPSDKLLTTQKESLGTVFEAGVDFPFYDKIKNGNVKVITSTKILGSITSQKFFRAQCDVRKYWAVNGGVMNYIRPKYLMNDPSEYIISGNQSLEVPPEKAMHFNQSTLGIYAGLSHRSIKKAIINSGGWNYRIFYSTRFYAQALIGATSAQDIMYNNISYKIDNAKQNTFGYRLGWQWDQLGVITGFEFGKMPGISLETPVLQSELLSIFKDNPYLNYVRFTFHFSIFNSDKNYHLKL